MIRNTLTEAVHLLLLVLTIVMILVGINRVQEYRCELYGTMTESPVKYEMIGGCFVQRDEVWMLKEQIRTF